MKTQLIGRSSLVSTRLAYGCMRLVPTWDPAKVTAEDAANGRRAVIAAFEAGYRTFDNADIYGGTACEKVFGDALREAKEMRRQIIVTTKCGIIFAKDGAPFRYDFSASHILRSCESSLNRMGVETIDLYHLHRPDFLMNPAEVAEAFEKLRMQGKVREFAVSNFTPSQVELLQAACPMLLVANQVEIHLGRLACFEDGTLDQCLLKRMTPLAWSPLGGGWLGAGGTVPQKHPRPEVAEKLLAVMDKLASAYGVDRTVLALAWLLKHPAGIIPIVGSSKPEKIKAAVKAEEVELSREDWYRLLEAARGERLP